MPNTVYLFAADPDLKGKIFTRFERMLADQKLSTHLGNVTNSLARLSIDLTPEMLDEAERATDLARDHRNRVNLLQAFAIYGLGEFKCLHLTYLTAIRQLALSPCRLCISEKPYRGGKI